jgi:ATP-dependent DNA helicase RecQ
MTLDELISRTLLLDVETTKSGKIREIGAILDGRVVQATAGASVGKTLLQVNDLSSGADFVLGHNLLGHDFPVLRTTYPHLAALSKPVIDTLYLSPNSTTLRPTSNAYSGSPDSGQSPLLGKGKACKGLSWSPV